MGILQASVWLMTFSENVSSRKGAGMLAEPWRRAGDFLALGGHLGTGAPQASNLFPLLRLRI